MTGPCLIVAPHPDDETIGAGIWMERHSDSDVTILHVTDGSPRDGKDARAHGFSSREAYADARRRELQQALGLLTAGRRRLQAFSYVDKESWLHLTELIVRMQQLIEDLRPAIVMSPAYEGGHPDHDTAALAVAAARQRVPHEFRHREYRLYHAGPRGEMATGDFLPADHSEVEVISLSAAEREKKQQMLLSFPTQTEILSRFPLVNEIFRDAPSYDFTKPPHPGTLLYERWDMGVSGAEWRRCAREALAALATGKML